MHFQFIHTITVMCHNLTMKGVICKVCLSTDLLVSTHTPSQKQYTQPQEERLVQINGLLIGTLGFYEGTYINYAPPHWRT